MVPTNGAGYTLNVTVDDQGNTGAQPVSATPISVSRTFSITAVNDAPVIASPSSAVGLEDTPLVFSVGQGNLISITDPDGNVSVEISLDASNGLLSLNGVNGLNFSVGDGSGDGHMRFAGTVSDINAALNGLVFNSDPNAFGTSFNDLPIVQSAQGFTLLGAASAVIDTSNLLSTDLESPAGQLIYTLESLPTQGDLLLNGNVLIKGATFTQADVNANAVSYRSLPTGAGIDQLQLTVRDADSGAAPQVTLKVSVTANPAYVGGSNANASSATSSNLGSSSSALSSSTINATTTAHTAGAKEIADVGNNALPSGASAAGSDSSSAQKLAGSRAGTGNNEGVSSAVAERASLNLGLIRQDQMRLPDSTPISINAEAPLSTNPLSAIPSSIDPGRNPAELDRPNFELPGINLPNQSIAFAKLTTDSAFQRNMEQVRDDVFQAAALDRNVVASTIGVSASFTIGYVLWLIRGGLSSCVEVG